MPILTKVEAKGWRGRLFLTLVTLALVVGGMTMLYPFMIMREASALNITVEVSSN